MDSHDSKPRVNPLARQALEKAGGVDKLVTALNKKVKRTTVYQWLNDGINPNYNTVKILEEYLGIQGPEMVSADFHLAPVIGVVKAGRSEFIEKFDLPHVFNIPADLKSSRWWHHTRACQSGRQAEYILVEGDSMNPEYPEGCHILCRPPADPRSLPQGIHAIIRGTQSGTMTFKALYFKPSPGTSRTIEITAMPINRQYEPQFFNSDEVSIDWIALAMTHTRINKPAHAAGSEALAASLKKSGKPSHMLREHEHGSSLAAEAEPAWNAKNKN